MFNVVSMVGVSRVERIKDSCIMSSKENGLIIINYLHAACGHKGEKKT